jgi:hypothetical protein
LGNSNIIVQCRHFHFWRLSDHRHDAGGRRLKVDLLGHIQGIIYLNPEIPDGALEFRMAKEELHCAQVSGLTVDLGGLRTPHRVRAINGRLQADAFNPAMHQSGILAGGYVRACMKSTWEEMPGTGSPKAW